ncbi:MAG: GH32 C-terminal domain-containing protein [Actinomycetota bacterium]
MRFTPSQGHVGDPVPFHHEGAYHLFYLRRLPGENGPERCPWGHAVSRDLRQWEALPDAFSPGPEGSPDSGGCWTGSVVEREGVFHAFYTGHAPGHPSRPQSVCVATSRDLIHWEKFASNPVLLPDARWYEPSDWRDPFVFWHPGERQYWMLITARLRRPAAAPRRGCIAVATSPDLAAWQVRGPLWAPFSMHAPECPDLWRDGDAWRLLYSNGATRARTAASLEGPWVPCVREDVDGRWFYAAKCFHVPSAGGDRHVLVGWIPSREGDVDAGARQWGGAMGLPREATTIGPGGLGWRVAEEVQNAWSRPLPDLHLQSVTGRWSRPPEGPRVDARDGMALALAHGVPPSFRLESYVELSPDGDADAFRRTSAGFVVRYGKDGESGYVLALDPARQQVLIRPWSRWGDAEPICSQPASLLHGRPIHVDLYLDGSLLEVFVDDQVVLSTRCYDHTAGSLGFWAQDGAAVFSNPWVYARP